MVYRPATMLLTDEQVSKVAELSESLNTDEIADYFGISRTTFYEIRKHQPVVAEQYKKGRACKIKKYVEKLNDHIFNNDEKGNVATLIFALKTYARWSEVKEESQVADIVETAEEKEFRIARTKKFLKWEAEYEGKDD